MKLKPKGRQKVVAQIAMFFLVVALIYSCAQRDPFLTDTPLAQAKPNLQVKTVLYDVTGSTAQQLRNQMSLLGPLRMGKHFDSYVDWTVDWNYRYQSQGALCYLTSANVLTKVTLTLPRWRSPRGASQQLINQWNQFMGALRIHQEGYKQHGIVAGQEVLKFLHSLPSQPSCPQLETAANTGAQRIIQKYNQKDIDYGRMTRHGATQGAVFP